MQNEGKVTQERGIRGSESEVRIVVASLCKSRLELLDKDIKMHLRDRDGFLGDVAVLATQITSLASILPGGVTEGRLAAVVWVEMGTGCCAVAIGGDWLRVDVVHC